MTALIYHGTKEGRVETVPDPILRATDEAADGYKICKDKADDCRKVVLTP
jgi:hypothetical protein